MTACVRRDTLWLKRDVMLVCWSGLGVYEGGIVRREGAAGSEIRRAYAASRAKRALAAVHWLSPLASPSRCYPLMLLVVSSGPRGSICARPRPHWLVMLGWIRVREVFTAVDRRQCEILMVRCFKTLDIALSWLLIVAPGVRQGLLQIERIRVGLLQHLGTSFREVCRPAMRDRRRQWPVAGCLRL